MKERQSNTQRYEYGITNLYYMEEGSTEENNRGEYLKIVQHYIEYYYTRADHYKRWYLWLSVIKIFVLAAIPVGQTIPQITGRPWLVAGASSLCILLESITELFTMKDKWILYREVGNNLMREQRQYVTRTGKYADGDAQARLNLFVPAIESIIESESSDWNRMIQAPKGEITEGKQR